MALDQTANFVRGEVASSVASGDTTINVVDASIYPDPANGNYNLVIWDAESFVRPDEDADAEVMRVTGRDTTNNNLTVTRGQESTTAVSHPSSSEMHLSATSKVFNDIDSKLFSSLTLSGSNGINGGSAELGGTINFGISGNLSLDSDLVAQDGEVIWDESATYIPQTRLENDAITVAGNSVSLGGSTAINHTNLSNIASDQHHIRYSDSEAISAVENASFTSLDTANIVESGTTHLSLDGSGNVEIPNGDLTDGTNTIYDQSNSWIPQARLQNDSVTIEGNSVSLGGSTSVNHNDLSSISSNDHHSKTSSASELTDVSADSVSDAHHSKYTDSNAVSAANAEISVSANTLSGLDSAVDTKIGPPDDNTFGQLVNVASTSNATSGDTVGYTLDIDGQTALTIEGTADGSGGLSSGPFVSGEVFGIEGQDDQVSQIINADNTSAATAGTEVGYTFGVDNITAVQISGTADGSGGFSSGPVMSLPDIGEDPTSNGEFINNSGDVKVYSGGSVVNLSGPFGSFLDEDGDDIAELNNIYVGAEIGDDIEFYFGAGADDFSIRDDSTADSLKIRDEGNNTDRVSIDRTTGNMTISGELTENSSI